jgi:tetratricopeptide (TPR) repeat protein
MYSRANKYDEAIKAYETSLTLRPESATTFDNLGYAFLDKGDYPMAIQKFIKCINLKPDNVDALLGLALCYYYQNDKLQAKNYLNAAKDLKPDLKDGVAGFEKFKGDRWSYSEKDDASLKTMLVEFND